MKKIAITSLPLIFLAACSMTQMATTPTTTPVATPAPAPAATAAASSFTSPPANTPLGNGQYKSIMEMDASIAKHTIYRPLDVAALSTKMPILVWGNGGCNDNGNAFRPFLTEIASNGYLVIANGNIGPMSAEAPPAPPPATAPNAAPRVAPPGNAAVANALPPAKTSTTQLIDAIDWALTENNRVGSKFFGKLDANKIAVAGQSCGGVQAIEASADARIKTTIVGNSGLIAPSTSMTGSGKALTKEELKKFHAPVLYMSGDASDIAYANANDDFEKISHIPVFRAYEKGIGHSGTYRNASGGSFAKVAVAWLNWQLNGDSNAAKMFVGAQCGLCMDSNWVTNKKKID